MIRDRKESNDYNASKLFQDWSMQGRVYLNVQKILCAYMCESDCDFVLAEEPVSDPDNQVWWYKV